MINIMTLWVSNKFMSIFQEKLDEKNVHLRVQ